MNLAIIYLILALIYSMLCFGCKHDTKTAIVPVFGSFASGEIMFDVDVSDYRPAHTLTEPGIISARWLQANIPTPLRVSVDSEQVGARTIWHVQADGTSAKSKEEWHFPRDHFLITIGGGSSLLYPFEASYEEFLVFPCDIDGDRIDEIVLEYGLGRGTSVYARKLEILKVIEGDVTKVLEVPLSGYLPPLPPRADPTPWQRRYWFVAASGARHDVVVELLPPEAVPEFLASEEDLRVLQHPRVRFTYNDRHKTFIIESERFRKTLSD